MHYFIYFSRLPKLTNPIKTHPTICTLRYHQQIQEKAIIKVRLVNVGMFIMENIRKEIDLL